MNDFWTPDNRWEGQDVFVLGGGPSLRGFDFSKLDGRNVLGCNEAFRIGYPTIQAMFFSDARWFVRVSRDLEKFGDRGGLIVCHEEALRFHNLPWLKTLRRKEYGLHKDAIGFGHNSGSSAINMALMLGAKRVLLLGYDCKRSEANHNNWHDYYKPYHKSAFVPPFDRFRHGMNMISKQLPSVFPGCEVINLTPDSALTAFPKAELEQYLCVTA